MKKQKALIVVDVQNDFCPGGSLAVPEGDAVVHVINSLLEKFDLVIFTKDWHPADHEGFASQHPGTKPFDKYTNEGEEDTLWPDHCVAGTLGAEFHPDLDLSKCKKDFYIFKKGTDNADQGYSGFKETGLKEFLDEHKVTDVFVTGLALDYCVKETAIDSSMAGFDTIVIGDACRGINPDNTPTIELFKEAHIPFVDQWVLEFLGYI